MPLSKGIQYFSYGVSLYYILLSRANCSSVWQAISYRNDFKIHARERGTQFWNAKMHSHIVWWILISWNSQHLCWKPLRVEFFCINEYIYTYTTYISRCFSIDEKRAAALENILMGKTDSVLGTILRQDSSLSKPMCEENEHVSRTCPDMDVDIAACFLGGGLSCH